MTNKALYECSSLSLIVAFKMTCTPLNGPKSTKIGFPRGILFYISCSSDEIYNLAEFWPQSPNGRVRCTEKNKINISHKSCMKNKILYEFSSISLIIAFKMTCTFPHEFQGHQNWLSAWHSCLYCQYTFLCLHTKCHVFMIECTIIL